MQTYDQIRATILSDIRNQMPMHLKRLNWTRQDITAHQTTALRKIIQYAKQNSSWYRETLKAIPENEITLDRLSELPILTKADIMRHWDAIVTISNVNYGLAERHLAALRDGSIKNPYYGDDLLFIATGGSSGVRGLFIWDKDFFVSMACITYRYLAHEELKLPETQLKKMAVIEAPTMLHGSRHLYSVNVDPKMRVHLISSDKPIKDMITELNQIQPTHLVGFASIIQLLSIEANHGKLRIQPQWISTNSEPLDEMGRKAMKEAWGVSPCNTWGSVEVGLVAVEESHHCGMVIAEDCAIIEVDEDRAYVTCFYNKSFPMIRYQIDDVLELAEVASHISNYRVIQSIAGRSDDWFIYKNDIRIHPLVFRSTLGQDKAIHEYQVIKTHLGAHIKIISDDCIDCDVIRSKLVASLRKAGLKSADVTIERVYKLSRHPETGKVKRFITKETT